MTTTLVRSHEALTGDAGTTRRRLLTLPPVLASAAGIAGLTGCSADEDIPEAPAEDLRGEVTAEEPAPAADVVGMAVPATARVLAALDAADDEANLVCSPLSAMIALGMTGLGAGGETRSQMEDVLGASMEDLALFAGTLRTILADVGEEQRAEQEDSGDDEEGEDAEPAVASLANAVWLQEDLDVHEEYLDDLSRHYDAGLFTTDFTDEGMREDARVDMNAFVEERTNGLIEELVPEGVLNEMTRLTLINALHLKAAWPDELEDAGEREFTTSGGESVQAPMLETTTQGWYEDDLCEATVLDTDGDQLALVLVRPRDSVAEVLAAWADDGEGLDGVLALADDSEQEVSLTLPGFDIATDAPLGAVLQDLGMTDAFSDIADFSGITDEEELFIAEVLQKAVITVDEEGMEAAAATAVIGETEAMPPEPAEELVLDAPFLFLAIERSTRAPLVVGRIGDPTQTRE